ncbi:hypothetical protein TA3x_004428 [Tundrisphaera sp. TA3]|uniref:hypothetical protein n=1 Tax=Tundrisphaera sp. TA3 TaxID=3435775 RepID=UPI003EBE10D7
MRSMIVWGIALAGLASGTSLERVGRFEAAAIREASGIVRSRRHADTYWVHNDSGNPPALFAVRRNGQLIRSYRVAAPNLDWEDIAADDDGNLYIGEIGNNDLRLSVRAIYRIAEPDPTRPSDDAIPLASATYFRYPDKDRFDAEALFISGGRAFLIAKRSDKLDAALYSVPLDPPAPVGHPVTAKRVGTLPGCTEPVTGADLSPDGQLLAVVTNSVVRVYRDQASKRWGLSRIVAFQAKDVEGICWDGMDLILASEDRSLYRIAEKTWRADPGAGRR